MISEFQKRSNISQAHLELNIFHHMTGTSGRNVHAYRGPINTSVHAPISDNEEVGFKR